MLSVLLPICKQKIHKPVTWQQTAQRILHAEQSDLPYNYLYRSPWKANIDIDRYMRFVGITHRICNKKRMPVLESLRSMIKVLGQTTGIAHAYRVQRIAVRSCLVTASAPRSLEDKPIGGEAIVTRASDVT